MKNDPTITSLVGVLAASVLLSVVLFLFYVKDVREKLSLEGRVLEITTRSRAVQMLIADTVFYSQKNSSIDPVLESIGVQVPKTAPVTNKPSGK